jgi:uncharacterized damage-inducible protein DinB
MRTIMLTVCLLASSTFVFAQNSPSNPVATLAQDNPISALNKRSYGQLKNWLLRSAEKMPEESYNFKPTDAVRSYGQILGHLADYQYMYCSILRGEKNPAAKTDQTSKADLLIVLQNAFAYCDQPYDGLTDVSALQMVKFYGGDTPRINVMIVNNMHMSEHYGNLVVYMRLKNIVPPSTESANMPPPKK